MSFFGKFEIEKAIMIAISKHYHFYLKAILKKSFLPRKSQKLFFKNYFYFINLKNYSLKTTSKHAQESNE